MVLCAWEKFRKLSGMLKGGGCVTDIKREDACDICERCVMVYGLSHENGV